MPKTITERRGLTLSAADVALRTVGDGDPQFFGHAAVFNSRTAIGNPLTWGFYEELADGAFTKTLDEGDSRYLVDHETRLVVSRVSAGSLRLAQDEIGLAVNSDLDRRLSYVGDLIVNIDNGNITGMSFGFEVVKDDWKIIEVETKDGNTAEAELRIIREVKLFEVSAVTFPAYEDTTAALRSVGVALAARGDDAAIARRAAFRPELNNFRREPSPEPASEPTRGGDVPQPGETTGTRQVMRMEALAARFRLAR
ncbi:HK97 family phage prohead protease [Streptomyces sp. SP18ES09]|uniref:HK97 family phage prohead protease n=1 Tax=Streptomyces sp. SP18ES09 TaxID=3002532 RepID=UPI002E76657F|nr:HK97 family phage prohead protease [Streptomyces sp. SP18ES09]MEE1813696.1 HK97 family phage prohead protease [Streptomyces sp. SP18ES09]